jgi:hypothetical protein
MFKSFTLSPKWQYLGLLLVVVLGFFAFKPARIQERVAFMQITTIESILPGGTGRSRMFVTELDGKQQEFLLENLYSMVGIKMQHINLNDRLILEKLNAYATEGWQVASVTTGVQSPSDNNNQGIFMTRYLLTKTIE